ncbi:MAG: tetratricopeptide repeat protein [Bacteroidota bacterium]|nr:tetratricopeptide repeat protein [Bacteroidota bacterium]
MKRLLLLFFFSISSLLCTAQINIDSLRSIWSNHSKPDTIRLKAIDDLIWFGYMQSQPDSVIYLASQQYKLAMVTNNLKYAALALNMQSNAFSIKGDFVKAREYLFKRLAIEKKLNNKKGMASVYMNLGNLCNKQNDDENALIYFFESLKLCDLLDAKQNSALVCDNIATVYMWQRDYDNALLFISKSMKIKNELGDSVGLGVNDLNFGIVYINKKKEKLALPYMYKAMSNFSEQNNKLYLSVCYGNLSILYSQTKDFDSAIYYQNEALKISREMKNPVNESKCLNELSDIYYQFYNNAKSVLYGEEAMVLAKKHNVLSVKKYSGERLSDIYFKTGDYKRALENYKIFEEADDSIKMEESKDAAYREKLKYEFEKKELKTKIESESKLIQLQNQAGIDRASRNNWYTIFISLIVLLIVGSMFLYNYLKQKNVIESQKNNIIQQKFLVSQMNPHFIFNSLGAIQSYIYRNDPIQAGVYLSKFSDLMRMILNYSRKDFISVESEVKLLENYIILQQLRFKDKFISTISIDVDIIREATFIPPMLAQPFVENAIEHGLFYKEGEGKIEIRLLQGSNSKELIYEIEDNGVGMKTAAAYKIGTKKEHVSHATKIARERMLAFGKRYEGIGKIEIVDKSELNGGNSGVKVRFVIPCKET